MARRLAVHPPAEADGHNSRFKIDFDFYAPGFVSTAVVIVVVVVMMFGVVLFGEFVSRMIQVRIQHESQPAHYQPVGQHDDFNGDVTG